MFTDERPAGARIPASRDSSLVTANGPLPRAVRHFWGQLADRAGRGQDQDQDAEGDPVDDEDLEAVAS